MKKSQKILLAILISAFPLFADQYTNLKVKTIHSSGENLVVVVFATTSATTSSTSSTIPSEITASVSTATGFNFVSFTVGDVKSYTAQFLTALTSGSLVDIDVGYTTWTGGYLFRSAKIK